MDPSDTLALAKAIHALPEAEREALRLKILTSAANIATLNALIDLHTSRVHQDQASGRASNHTMEAALMLGDMPVRYTIESSSRR